MGTWRQNVGSTIFILIGIVEWLSGISQGGSTFVAGMTIFFGALAFRFAKTRRLLNVPFFSVRSFIEIVFILASLASVFLQNNLKLRLATDPTPFFFSIIAFFAYIFAATKIWNRK